MHQQSTPLVSSFCVLFKNPKITNSHKKFHKSYQTFNPTCQSANFECKITNLCLRKTQKLEMKQTVSLKIMSNKHAGFGLILCISIL